MFLKTLLKTMSPAQNARSLTHLLYRFVIICWYNVICTVATSRNLFVISTSLAMASVLASSRIFVRSVGTLISV